MSSSLFSLEPISTSDLIQLGMFGLASATIAFTGWQLRLQTRVMKAQLLKDRFEMYWRNYEPVSGELVSELEAWPKAYMPPDQYAEFYASGQRSTARYISHSRTYEYLAFLYVLHYQMNIEDPLGPQWADSWINELLESPEFLDAHTNYGAYYPAFRNHVNRIRGNADA
jgi:hypothetical protein